MMGCGQRDLSSPSRHHRGERLQEGRGLILEIGLDGQRGVKGTTLLRGLESQLQLVDGSGRFIIFVGLKTLFAGREPGDRERVLGTDQDNLRDRLSRTNAAEVDDCGVDPYGHQYVVR